MPRELPSDCTLKTCPLTYAFLTYVPSLPGNVLYLTLFVTILLTQLLQGLHYKTWSFTISMLMGLLLEVIGYLGRIQMHFNPFIQNYFLTYLICITIGPVFFSAALYLCLSRLIVHYGRHHSRLSPKTISISFITCDWIALVLQAVGGALADTASTIPMQDQGVHIMVAGLGFQVLTLLAFVCVGIEFIWNVNRQGSSENEESNLGSTLPSADKANEKSIMIFIFGLASATLLILIRSSFRVAELAKGFGSRLANEEMPFVILEGAMIILATIVLSVFHPGRAFGAKWIDAGWK